MTAPTVEDLFLADDLRALGGVHAEAAEMIDRCTTHEDVEKVRLLLTWWTEDSEDNELLTHFLEPDRRYNVEELRRVLGLSGNGGQ